MERKKDTSGAKSAYLNAELKEIKRSIVAYTSTASKGKNSHQSIRPPPNTKALHDIGQLLHSNPNIKKAKPSSQNPKAAKSKQKASDKEEEEKAKPIPKKKRLNEISAREKEIMKESLKKKAQNEENKEIRKDSLKQSSAISLSNQPQRSQDQRNKIHPPSVNKGIAKVISGQGNKISGKKYKSKGNVQEQMVPSSENIGKTEEEKERGKKESTKKEGNVFKEISEFEDMPSRIREFENLNSILHEWIFINTKLENTFKLQKQNSLNTLYERFLQVLSMKNELYIQRRDLLSKENISILDQSLLFQYDLCSDIEGQFEEAQENVTLLNNKIANMLDRLKIGNNILIKPDELLDNLTYLKTQLKEFGITESLNSEEIQELIPKLEELSRISLEEETELLKALKLIKTRIHKLDQEKFIKITNKMKEREALIEKKALNIMDELF